MGNTDATARLVEQLEHFRRHPTDYVRPHDVSHVESFLRGIDVALNAHGVVLDHAAIRHAHGFPDSPLTIAQLMQVHGVEPTVVVNRLIDFTIEALRSWAAEHPGQ